MFDKIFREKATQEDVYTFSAKPIVAGIVIYWYLYTIGSDLYCILPLYCGGYLYIHMITSAFSSRLLYIVHYLLINHGMRMRV